MSKQPLLILSICFILGIFFQDAFSLHGISVYIIAGSCILLLIPILFRSYFLHQIRPVLLGLLFIGVGIVFHSFNISHVDSQLKTPLNHDILFKISKKLNSTPKYKKYEAILQVEKENCLSVIYVPQKYKELDFKHYYKAKAFVTRPASPKYDFLFNYTKYLGRKGIYYQTYLSSEVSSTKRNDLKLAERLSQKRLEVLQSIDKTAMSLKSKTFLKGIILADRTEIDPDTVKDFNRSGLVHFLAISGTHIVVIFGIFYFLFVQFLPLKFRKYAVILSLVFIWLFAAFIGFGNSVLRSCIMLSVYFIYILLQRKPDLLHSLALSAFIILILDTHQLFDVGFQLSFLAVLGIFWLNQPILKYFPKQDNYFKRLIFNAFSISIAAQLTTLPLVLLYFHQFSFISIVANFFIVPFSELIIVLSFVMTFLIAVGIDIPFINAIYDTIIQVLLNMIHWFADFDLLFVENIPLNLVEVFALFVVIYFLRFAVIKFDFRNLQRVIMAVLLFLILRTGFNIVECQKDEVLIQEFYKDRVLLIKKGSSAYCWISEHSNKEKVKQYFINPYISSRRLKKIEIKSFPDSVQKVVYGGKIYNIK